MNTAVHKQAKPAYIILDIDNCIANDAWRIPYIDWTATNGDERYYVYHSLCMRDEAETKWLHDFMRSDPQRDWSGVGVLALTARPTSHERETRAWLQMHLPAPLELSALLMRNVGDARHSAQVKSGQVKDLIDHWGVNLAKVLFAADDRKDVCDMYAGWGLMAIQHAIHDVCAYTPPAAPIPVGEARLTVPGLLEQAAATFAERNGTYGDNYKSYGAIMSGLFPQGLEVATAEDWGRLAIVMSCVNKLSRYTWASAAAGEGVQGHRDSARDLIVYAAMLEEMTS